MAIRTISGTLTIPTSEPSTGGFYDDVTIRLYLIDSTGESLTDEQDIPTTNLYSFTFDDEGKQAIVKIYRPSTDTVLGSTPTRGVLPRSFLIPNTDPVYYADTKTDNYTFDSGLSILATSGGRYFSLAKEITNGILQADQGSKVPFKVNHVYPSGNSLTPSPDQYFRTGTIAMVAYSLGYYLEKNPYATNVPQVGLYLYNLLTYLAQRQHIGLHGGLVTAGQGIYSGGTLVSGYTDNTAYTIDNILSYFAFKQAGWVLNGSYSAAASDLYEVIMDKLWNPINLRFIGGRQSNGTTIQDNLETNYLGVYLLKEESELSKASNLLTRIESLYTCVDSTSQVSGYRATTGDTSVWFEGSYGVAIAYRKMNNGLKYSKIVKELNRFLQSDGSFQYGVIKDGQYQVKTWESVGSTAWSYMANRFPNDVFTIRDTASVPSGIPNRYVNGRYEDEWDNTTCASGYTPTPFAYWCPVGYYISPISQTLVDQNAYDLVNDFGQAMANTYGICSQIPLYWNEEQTGTYQKQGCGSGLVGTYVDYVVSGNTYGSVISLIDANNQAIADVIANGQAYANSHGSCVVQNDIVYITVSLTSVNNGFDDEIYATAYSSIPVLTPVDVEYEYGAYGVDGTSTLTILSGSSNTFSQLVTTVPAGQGDYYTATVVDVTPGTYGNQIYLY